MIVYLDTSSLVKLYAEEVGSQHIKEITRAATVISTAKIAYAEARAAFARKQKEVLPGLAWVAPRAWSPPPASESRSPSFVRRGRGR